MGVLEKLGKAGVYTGGLFNVSIGAIRGYKDAIAGEMGLLHAIDDAKYSIALSAASMGGYEYDKKSPELVFDEKRGRLYIREKSGGLEEGIIGAAVGGITGTLLVLIGYGAGYFLGKLAKL